MLVLPCMPNGPEVIITASIIAASTTAFSGILLTYRFLNCRNRGSDCVIGRGI